jgi:4-alpha-glucanotransferase
MPIYVVHDSADVWTHPEIFKLDEEKRPEAVAGVPPDYFSATGQLWGNPVYRWDVLERRGFDWWLERIDHNLALFDWVRIDHFRGFVGYWEVPAGEKTALNGTWIQAPAERFFEAVRGRFPEAPIVAEDLGVITPDVRKAMARFGFPGMKILLFAFGEDLPEHPYIPHNFERNCVGYTGTHDNTTVRGWFEREASPEEKKWVFRYLGREIHPEDLPWELIRLLMMSVANTVIFPMQDVLALGEDARMNRPSTTHGNWRWRLQEGRADPELSLRLREMAEIYGRAP